MSTAPRTVLALDLGTSLGWAVGGPSVDAEEWEHGTENLSPKPGESPGFRMIRLRVFLNTLLNAYPDIQLITYEEAPGHGTGRNTRAAHVYGGLEMGVQAWCIEKGKQHTSAAPNTIKKHATGKGNAGKPEMLEAANQIFGGVKTHDEADALWLLSYTLNEYGGSL